MGGAGGGSGRGAGDSLDRSVLQGRGRGADRLGITTQSTKLVVIRVVPKVSQSIAEKTRVALLENQIWCVFVGKDQRRTHP